MMSRGKAFRRAAAPLAVLLLIAAGARLLFSLPGVGDPANRLSSSTVPLPTDGSETAPPFSNPPEPVDAQTQAILSKIVAEQLAAIARDDFADAIRYSSPQFRQTYTPDTFRQMVETATLGF